MASSATTAGAVVVDANVAIAVATKEAGREVSAKNALASHLAGGYRLYAPGVIVAEVLYVLCGKNTAGVLTPTDYALAVQSFDAFMTQVLSPPNGDKSLITRANQITASYGCSRSSDGIYIALAEEMAITVPTILLTFDRDLPKQAAKNAPSVSVQLL